MVKLHVEPPPIPLINIKHDGNSGKGSVKLKLSRGPTSDTPDLYEFKIALLENGEPEEFLLFVRNFNMNIAASGTLETDTKVQYLCTLVCRESLRRFDLMYDDVKGMNYLAVEDIILGLAAYFFL